MPILVLEGADGVGKTTIAQEICELLGPSRSKYFRMPGSTKLAELLRPVLKDKSFSMSLRVMTLLFQAVDEDATAHIEAYDTEANSSWIDDRPLTASGGRAPFLCVVDRCGLSNWVYRMALRTQEGIRAAELASDLARFDHEHGLWRPLRSEVVLLEVDELTRRSRLAASGRSVGVGEDRFDGLTGVVAAYRQLFCGVIGRHGGVSIQQVSGMTSREAALVIMRKTHPNLLSEQQLAASELIKESP